MKPKFLWYLARIKRLLLKQICDRKDIKEWFITLVLTLQRSLSDNLLLEVERSVSKKCKAKRSNNQEIIIYSGQSTEIVLQD